MSEEIIAGLKNAIERGISLEEAIQSFINAGYNPVEVRQSAQALTTGTFSFNEYAPQGMPEERFHEDEEKEQIPKIPSTKNLQQTRPTPQPSFTPQAPPIAQRLQQTPYAKYPQQQYPQPLPQQQPLQQPTIQPTALPFQQQFGFTQPKPAEIRLLPQQKKQNIGVIILLVVLLLLLIGGLVYMILNGQELLDKLLQSA